MTLVAVVVVVIPSDMQAWRTQHGIQTQWMYGASFLKYMIRYTKNDTQDIE